MLGRVPKHPGQAGGLHPSGMPRSGCASPELAPTFVQIADGRLLLQKVTAELLVQAERQHVVNEGAEEGQRCSW